jgi:hypothetical protein
MAEQQLYNSFLGEHPMKKSRKTLGLIFALTLGASASVNGSELYNNIPDLNYDLNQDINNSFTIREYIGAFSFGRSLNLPGDYIASLFSTPTCASNCSPLTLGNVTLTMFGSADSGFSKLPASSINVEVYSNAATFLEGDPNLATDNILDTLGTKLTTLTPNGSLITKSVDNNVFTSNTLALNYNTKYWVKLSASGGSLPAGSSATWLDLSKNDIDSFLQPGQLIGQPPVSFVYCAACGAALPVHGNFYTDPQLLMRVETSAVPVPGAAWLMGSALLGLMRPWRRKSGH